MEALRLHVGCGNRRLEGDGWINSDISDVSMADLVMDARSLEYKDNTVDEIYACHLLEHMEDPGEVLQEWHRVLKYHGILRLSVPDMEEIFAAYNAGVHLDRLSGLIWGGHKYPGDEHLHGWDFEELARLLRNCGFFDVQRWWPQRVFPSGYHDISYAKVYTNQTEEFLVSLNIRALRI